MNTFLNLKFTHNEIIQYALKSFFIDQKLLRCLGDIRVSVKLGGNQIEKTYFGHIVSEVYAYPFNEDRVNLF